MVPYQMTPPGCDMRWWLWWLLTDGVQPRSPQRWWSQVAGVPNEPLLCLQPSDYISTFSLESKLDNFKLRHIYALFFTRRPKISMENVDKLKAFVISASVSLVTKKKKIIFPTKTKPAAHSLGQFIPIFAFALASMVQSSTMVAKAFKMCLPLVYEVGAHLPLLPPVQDSSWWDKCLYRPHPIQKVILMFAVMLGKQHCSLWWWDKFSVGFFSDFFFFFVLTSWIFTAPGHQRSPSKGSALCCRYAKQNPGFLLNFSHTGWWD